MVARARDILRKEDLAEARMFFERALAAVEAGESAETVDVVAAHRGLAHIERLEAGCRAVYEKAERLERAALAAAESAWGVEDARLAPILAAVGVDCASAGRTNEGLEHLFRSLALADRHHLKFRRFALLDTTHVLLGAGRAGEAAAFAEQYHAEEEARDPEATATLFALYLWTVSLHRAGRHADALDKIEMALRLQATIETARWGKTDENRLGLSALRDEIIAALRRKGSVG
jgi:hypothetical protein